MLLTLAAATLIGATPARAGVILSAGGVNLDAYCRSLGAGYAVRDSTSVSGWSCQYQGSRQPLSIGQACQYQLAPLLAAGLTVGEDSGTDPAQRRCLVVGSRVGNLGGMDLARYCRSQGWSGAVNSGHTVDGWFCTPQSEASRINLNAVCSWQYGVGVLTPAAFFLSAADAYRISCYGYAA
ncbi:hypothetical protein L083_2394 [Actinoplanes sp. N902-109]|nr:hypothetical protein L083_2394 [Actinoplanes sp. N902-109]